ncbi:hypothetical protein [Pyrobaculum calidifontis]|uniref:Uncharacterized protein n=1 Tax=Pyrobaculum calidifontis (strain DSM 21063 / JCM 11548 / VA1) TaxID=410359 RepID=A3MU29_PYRCJ|nr:hypothetical protein [Pyrobaculum calidifontis]ABO08146.1 hypothetical protein Pcal_0720 [Pyrobaculum calidifontis JCM 11548]
MGSLVKVVVFPQAEARYRVVDELKRRAGEELVYNRIVTVIPRSDVESVTYDDREGHFERGIKLVIPLKLKVSRGDVPLRGSEVLGEDYFRLEVEVPEEVVTLRGEWRVKRKVTCSFFYYVDRDLEDVAVLTSAEGVKAINGAVEALRMLHIYVPDTRLELPRGQKFREMLSRLGELGWISISEIQDVSIRFAIVSGRWLERHPVVSDLSERGQVTALVINKEGLRLILSVRGIYVQQRLAEVAVAERVAEVVKVLKEFGVFKPG